MHHPSIRILACALGASLLAACSGTDAASSSAAARSASAAADPCALLRDAEVRRVFPDAAGGRRNDSLQEQGIAVCEWKSPAGRIALEWVRDGYGVDDWMEIAETGAVDPLRPPEQRPTLRQEAVAGVGDEAKAIIERADPARGVGQVSVLAFRRGPRDVVVIWADLAQRERADALAALTELGRAAAGRL